MEDRKEMNEIMEELIIKRKGKPKLIHTEIQICGCGGELAVQAVKQLAAIINGIEDMGTKEEVIAYFYVISGFATCCLLCGFMTEKSTDDLMRMVEHVADNKIERLEAESEAANV